MAELNITTDELLAEIDRLNNSQPEGVAISDLVAQTGHGEQWWRTQMRKMIAAGHMVFAGRAKRMRMDGYPCHVPVYRRVRN